MTATSSAGDSCKPPCRQQARKRMLSWLMALLAPCGNGVWANDASRLVCAQDQPPVRFTTTEASGVDLDVSPDGKRIVFSMLGDVYVVPTNGGTATALTTGPDWDVRPVWSPDGRHVAFISDREGSDHVFVMDPGAPGKTTRITPPDVARGLEGVIQGAEWMPDASALVVDGVRYAVRQGAASGRFPHFPGGRFYGNARGLHAFAQERPLAGSASSPAKGRVHALWRLSQDGLQDTGERIGPAMAQFEAPVVTRDGRWIVYRGVAAAGDMLAGTPAGTDGASPVDVLRVLDRTTGRDRALVGPGAPANWRSHGRVDGYPTNGRFAASADSRQVFFSYAGQIHRIDLESGASTPIPIVVDVVQCLAPTLRNEVPIDQARTAVKNTRDATLRPGGGALVFSAMRKLHVIALPDGKARPLVAQPGGHGQFQPAYSPDGRWIAYVSWSETEGGHVWRVPAKGGTPVRLTSAIGRYQHPAWSPDGRMIAFVGSPDTGSLGRASKRVSAGYMHVMPSSGGRVTRLPPQAWLGHPLVYSVDGRRLHYVPYVDALHTKLSLHSISLEDHGTRNEGLDAVLPSDAAARVVPSPDGRLLALVKQGNLHVMGCAAAIGSPGFRASDCVQVQVTRSGGGDPRWRRGGAELEWSFADMHYRATAQALLAQVRGEAVAFHREARQLHTAFPRRRASGTLVLQGARLITMRGDEVIEKGAVRVEDGRIMQAGTIAEVHVPRGATVMDMTGKTIMPGFIDAHAHVWDLPDGLLDANHGEALVYLAFGVTTLKDPAHGGDQNFAYAEMIDAGEMVGPRMFGADSLMLGDRPIDTFQDAVDAARRNRRLGGTFLKYHTGWDRRQRRWIIEAARQQGLNVAAHFPASNYSPGRPNLTTVLDGATTLEHEPSNMYDIFGDIAALIATSGASVNFASISGHGGYPRAYWRKFQGDPRMRAFYVGKLPGNLDDDAGSQMLARLPKLLPQSVADAVLIANIGRRNGRVAIGSHGDYDGIGMHMEMWAHAEGGMRHHDILRAATLNGAHAIGVQAELGSIEAGKVADLVVMGRNPLDDIHHTLSVEHVMKDGVLREARTLEERWPSRKPLPAW